ncbi:hypothetical protein Y5W_01312 [Alcanivorax sp. 521-1]|uniref:Type II toxin-antitoxin system RelE/ParE family toxin n=1 Tax=Alloalcanivorax profundimaris TaxID=2735259 RepID=A0ABS0APL1_9GAMM|nr:hypothetical protein [Alloalcanivorax profundimaris]MBF5056018.1 hypothetical protein [Alloalcanivorax profundimaris]
MIFIETPVFTKRLRDLLDDESYAAFQQDLADSPQTGDVIQGTGGLRKVRVAASGRGTGRRTGYLLSFRVGFTDRVTADLSEKRKR